MNGAAPADPWKGGGGVGWVGAAEHGQGKDGGAGRRLCGGWGAVVVVEEEGER